MLLLRGGVRSILTFLISKAKDERPRCSCPCQGKQHTELRLKACRAKANSLAAAPGTSAGPHPGHPSASRRARHGSSTAPAGTEDQPGPHGWLQLCPDCASVWAAVCLASVPPPPRLHRPFRGAPSSPVTRHKRATRRRHSRLGSRATEHRLQPTRLRCGAGLQRGRERSRGAQPRRHQSPAGPGPLCHTRPRELVSELSDKHKPRTRLLNVRPNLQAASGGSRPSPSPSRCLRISG